jgi:translation elongation factor EF-G
MEPFMHMDIEIPESILGDTLADLTGTRGGRIMEINNVRAKFSDDIDASKKLVTSLLPLSQIVGYSKFL